MLSPLGNHHTGVLGSDDLTIKEIWEDQYKEVLAEEPPHPQQQVGDHIVGDASLRGGSVIPDHSASYAPEPGTAGGSNGLDIEFGPIFGGGPSPIPPPRPAPEPMNPAATPARIFPHPAAPALWNPLDGLTTAGLTALAQSLERRCQSLHLDIVSGRYGVIGPHFWDLPFVQGLRHEADLLARQDQEVVNRNSMRRFDIVERSIVLQDHFAAARTYADQELVRELQIQLLQESEELVRRGWVERVGRAETALMGLEKMRWAVQDLGQALA